MRFTITKSICLASLLLLGGSTLSAQDGSALPTDNEVKKKIVQFNGLGRAILNNTSLGGDILDTDTTTARKLTDGEFLLDLAVNAQPNENTEIQGILRLRNEFGGFFGAGVTVEIRELWARGTIANKLKYRVGDFDHVMTPFTFYNAEEEGMINEPEVFRPNKEVIYYEQFYGPNNERRLQGANLEFGLDFASVLKDMDLMGFVARIRGTDFFTVPTRFVGGGRVGMNTQVFADSINLNAKLGLNVSNVWDDLNSGEANAGIRNLVWSVDYDVTAYERGNIGIHVLGEAGQSSHKFIDDNETEIEADDWFLEAVLAVDIKSLNMRVSAGYLNVGPDFFSMAAQSKRVDFTAREDIF